MTICQPKVYLLGRQQVDDVEMERFLKDIGTPDYLTDAASPGEVLVEVGGRVCYLSFANPRPGGMQAYADNILRSDHTSVLEHAVFTLMVTGVSRSLTHELVRHRHASPSQLSQRYVDESVCEVVVPPAMEKEVRLAMGYLSTQPGRTHLHPADLSGVDEEVLELAMRSTTDTEVWIGLDWLLGMVQSSARYKRMSDYLFNRGKAAAEQVVEAAHADNFCGTFKLLDLQAARTAARKKAREAARSVLPNATETKIQLTLNAQAARHLFYRRGSKHADPEIRNLAVLVFDRLKADSPNLFQDITKLEDGTLSSPLWRDC